MEEVPAELTRLKEEPLGHTTAAQAEAVVDQQVDHQVDQPE